MPRPGGLFTFPGKSIIPLTFPANTNKETPLCCRVFGRAEPRLAQLGGGWITPGFTLGTGQGRTAPGNPGAPGMQPQGRHPLPAPVTPATTQPSPCPQGSKHPLIRTGTPGTDTCQSPGPRSPSEQGGCGMGPLTSALGSPIPIPGQDGIDRIKPAGEGVISFIPFARCGPSQMAPTAPSCSS